MTKPTTEAVPARSLRKGNRVTIHGDRVTVTRRPRVLTGSADLGHVRVHFTRDDGTRDSVRMDAARMVVLLPIDTN